MTNRIIYLRPSSAHTWGKCAGFAKLNATVKALPEFADNSVREDGTATHWLASEQALSGGVWPWPLGELSPNGREITEELIRGAEDYLAVIKSWNDGPHLFIETSLPTGSIFPGTQDGTPDAFMVSPHSTLGRLADLKMGFRLVEVWRHPQLIVYGWTLFCLYPHLTELELTIVQPRAAHRDGPVRTWRVTREEMRPLAEHLQAMAVNAHAADPVCTLNDGCGDCGAAHACVTLMAAGGVGIDAAYDATPLVLTPVQIGYELTKLQAAAKHMEHRITGLTAQAESIARRDGKIPGFTMGRIGTRWRWKDEHRDELVTLGKALGVDVFTTKLKTVPQLRDAFPGLNVQSMYAELPTGALRLEATDPNEAIKAFTHRK